MTGAGQSGDVTPISRFRRFYEASYGFVWNVLRRLGVSDGDLDDIVQDVFLTAYRRWDTFDAQRSPKPWLYGIARRAASNARRAQSRGRRKQQALCSVHGDTQAPPVDAWISVEDFASRLAPSDREMFLLSELEGMTGPELAARFELNLNTVYSRLRVLRQRRDLALQDPLHKQTRESTWAALLPQLTLPVPAPMMLGGGLLARVVSSSWFAAATIPACVFGATLGLAAPRSDASAPPQSSARPRGASLATIERTLQAGARKQPTEVAHPVVASEAASRAATKARAAEGRSTVTHETKDRPAEGPSTAMDGISVSDALTADGHRGREGGRPHVADEGAMARDSREGLARSNEQLRRASDAIRRGRYEEALALCTTLAPSVHKSPLDAPRLALEIEALCGLGRTTEAYARATQMMEEYPASSVRSRVARSCSAAAVQ